MSAVVAPALRRARRLAAIAALSLGSIAFGPVPAQAAGTVRLAWDASPEADVTGYVVSYRSEDGQTNAAKNVGKVTTAQLDGLRSGQRYFFSVYAYNAAGLRSLPTQEVSGIVDGPVDTPTGGTPQPASQTTYFAEGATGPYSYRLAIVNTTTSPSEVKINFLRQGTTPVERDYTIAAQARLTVDAQTIGELSSSAQAFGAVFSAAPGVVAERTMSWNAGSFAAGAHTAKALAAPAKDWYLAEGAAGFYDTFVLIANPGATAATADVSFLREDGQVIKRTVAVPASGRTTIFTNEIPELVTHTFGTTVHADQAVLVERSMYFAFSKGGHWEGTASAAVPAPNTHWFLAEGHAGSFFSTFVLLSNPNASAVDVTVKYLTDDGLARTEVHHLAATSRETIDVHAVPDLNGRQVSFDITSTAPIIAERSMYWPGVPGPWYGSHNSTGVNALSTDWALAEGEFGGPSGAETYVLLVNPGTAAAAVTLEYYREDGRGKITATRTVNPGARITVSAGEVGGFDSGERFGIHVTSSQPIAVERSIYASPNGIFWKSGTNETGTPLK